MPTRVIREGILTSERVNSLSERAELFYRRLMSVVDDYGRFPANLTLLRASCYPLKLDCIKEDSIKKHLAEAEGAGLIVLYMVAGKAYLEMQDFGQRIQSKSKYPAPPDHGQESPVDGAVYQKSTVNHGEPPKSTALVGVEDEDVKPPLPPASGGEVWKLPDWVPKDLWGEFEKLRRGRRKPLTDRGRKLAVGKLQSLQTDGHDVSLVMEQTILHAWDTFYPLKTPPPAQIGSRPWETAI